MPSRPTDAGHARRAILKAGAWSLPVIAMTVAAPIASATNTGPIEIGKWYDNAKTADDERFGQPFPMSDVSPWSAMPPTLTTLHRFYLFSTDVGANPNDFPTVASISVTIDPATGFEHKGDSSHWQSNPGDWGGEQNGSGQNVQVEIGPIASWPYPENNASIPVTVVVVFSDGTSDTSTFTVKYEGNKP